MAVYNACVLSTLLHGNQTWATYARKEKRLNTFHLRSIRRILGISLQGKVSNVEVLSRAGLPTMYTLLRQRRLSSLSHVRRMEDGPIPKDILYGELATGQRSTVHPHLRFKDLFKRDMRALDINPKPWENLATDRGSWRNTLDKQLSWAKKSWYWWQTSSELAERSRPPDLKPYTDVTSATETAQSQIGLLSHRRRCWSRADSLDGSTHGWPWPTEAYWLAS